MEKTIHEIRQKLEISANEFSSKLGVIQQKCDAIQQEYNDYREAVKSVREAKDLIHDMYDKEHKFAFDLSQKLYQALVRNARLSHIAKTSKILLKEMQKTRQVDDKQVDALLSEIETAFAEDKYETIVNEQ
jgi:hypothetical protein